VSTQAESALFAQESATIVESDALLTLSVEPPHDAKNKLARIKNAKFFIRIDLFVVIN
jgi:hypothetical protein